MDSVVTAALFRGSKVLLCHRSPGRRHFPNVWDLPGGHLDALESPRAALIRELREELAIDLAEADVPKERSGLVLGPDFEMSVWRIDSWLGEPINAAVEEHDEIRWFSLSDALELPLAHPAYSDLLRELAAAQPRLRQL